MLSALSMICEACVSDKSSLQMDRKTKYYSLGESWFEIRRLREKLSGGLSNEDAFNIKPWELSTDSFSARYYANRGAIAFLLAHEFAHAYLNHVTVRSQAENLRSINELNDSLTLLRLAGLDLARGSELLFKNEGFLVGQPIETEADSFALLATAAMCGEMELDFKSLCVYDAWSYSHFLCLGDLRPNSYVDLLWS